VNTSAAFPYRSASPSLPAVQQVRPPYDNALVRSGEAGRQHALRQVRRDILCGALGPHQKLEERALGSRYGVNRASIRAALLHLASEGLVERIPHRGARVRGVTADEAIATAECRLVLEELCAAKAAAAATDTELDQLGEAGRLMTRAVTGGDILRFCALEDELTLQLARTARQPTAAELLARLTAQPVRHRLRAAMLPGRTRLSLGEHLAVIEAIRARDPQAAGNAVTRRLSGIITSLSETAWAPPAIPSAAVDAAFPPLPHPTAPPPTTT
jgi:DNA-binding GntR family transcriptional regulator